MVLSTPVVHYLKTVTKARLTWAIDEGIAPLLEGHPDVDEFILFPRNPFQSWTKSLPHLMPKLAQLMGSLQSQSFDLAIDLQGRGRTYFLLQLARARVKIGRGRFPFLQQTILHRRQIRRHAVESNFEAADLLRMPRPAAAEIFLPSSKADHQHVTALLRRFHVDGPLACLIPGATWPSKRWPAEYWAEVANWLIERGHWVALVGSATEASIGRRILERASCRRRVIPFFDLLTLRQLISLFELSRLVITGDTGPMHIAAATCTPMLALFGPTDPARTGPWPPHQAVILTARDCQTCRLPRCRRGCMRNLLPSLVMATLPEMLDASKPLQSTLPAAEAALSSQQSALS